MTTTSMSTLTQEAIKSSTLVKGVVLERTLASQRILIVKSQSRSRPFKNQFGDCLVRSDYLTVSGFKLGAWVRNQRERFKLGRLTSDRIQHLDELGFIWNVK